MREDYMDGLLGYAAELIITPKGGMQASEVRSDLEGLISSIGIGCVDAGVDLIGHIKLVMEVEEQGYLAMSVTTHDGAVSTKGEIEGCFEDLQMVLNVIVYGLDEGTVDGIIDSSLRRWFPDSAIELNKDMEHHHHDHGHHDHDHCGHDH